MAIYRQRQARLAAKDYHPDEGSYPGGSHETATVADPAADHTSGRWPSSLGSGLSPAVAVDTAADNAGSADDSHATGGV